MSAQAESGISFLHVLISKFCIGIPLPQLQPNVFLHHAAKSAELLAWSVAPLAVKTITIHVAFTCLQKPSTSSKRALVSEVLNMHFELEKILNFQSQK